MYKTAKHAKTCDKYCQKTINVMKSAIYGHINQMLYQLVIKEGQSVYASIVFNRAVLHKRQVSCGSLDRPDIQIAITLQSIR